MASRAETLDGNVPPKKRKWRQFIERSLPAIVIYLLVVTLVGFMIAPNVIVNVPTGHVGILWKRFRGARTTFDRHRRAFFSKLDERNAEAKKTKQKLIAEALEGGRTADIW